MPTSMFVVCWVLASRPIFLGWQDIDSKPVWSNFDLNPWSLLSLHLVQLTAHDASLSIIDGILKVSDGGQYNGGNQLGYSQKTDIPEAVLAGAVTGVLWCLSITIFYIGSIIASKWWRVACGLLGVLIGVVAPFVGILGVFWLFHSNVL